MKISYNWLKNYLKGKFPSPEKLGEIFNLHLFELEGLEKKGRDYIFDLDILPNRAPDCLSFIGLARELSVILPLKLVLPKKIKLPDKKARKHISFTVENKKDCRSYIGLLVDNVRIRKPPLEIKKRIESLGLNSINNVVDILNYVMLEIGQPLQAFDLDRIEGNEIKVRRARRGEKIKTLDGRDFSLGKEVLLIADKKDALAIAGIKGGKKAEITKNTKRILVESANFDPLVIRRSRQKLGIQTDASLRFEHNIPIFLTKEGIERIIYLFKKYGVGDGFSTVINYSSQKDCQRKVSLSFDKLERLSGVSFKKNEVKNILKKLGFQIVFFDKEKIEVKTPLWRKDVSLPEDLIEEVIRIKGLNFIPSVSPKGWIFPPQVNEKIFWENELKDLLKSLSFSEIYSYSFIGENEARYFGFKNLIELENPLSERQKYLRPCLLPNLFKITKENLKYFSNFRIFELGSIYYKDRKGIVEKKRLTGLIVDSKEKKEQEIFAEAKGVTDSLFESLGITDSWYDDFQPLLEKNFPRSAWEEFTSADIKVGNKKIGSLGLVSKEFLEGIEIEAKISVFDIDFEELWRLSSEEREYQPPSPYPGVIRDISVLVPIETKVVELLNIINQAGGKIVRDVDLFDMYEGENLPEGRKSLAFHIVYQSDRKTLTSEEVDKIHQKIIKAIENNPQWEVRK